MPRSVTISAAPATLRAGAAIYPLEMTAINATGGMNTNVFVHQRAYSNPASNTSELVNTYVSVCTLHQYQTLPVTNPTTITGLYRSAAARASFLSAENWTAAVTAARAAAQSLCQELDAADSVSASETVTVP